MSLFPLICAAKDASISSLVLLELVRDDFVTAMTTSDLDASGWVSQWYPITSNMLCNEIQAAIVAVFPPFVHHLISFAQSTLLDETKVQFVIEFETDEAAPTLYEDDLVCFPSPSTGDDAETLVAQYIRDEFIESMCFVPFRNNLKKDPCSFAFQFLDGVTQEGIEKVLHKWIPKENIVLYTRARCQSTEVMYIPYGINVTEYAPGWKAAPRVVCSCCRSLYPSSYKNAINYLIVCFQQSKRETIKLGIESE